MNQTTDNNLGNFDVGDKDFDNFSKIADVNIRNLKSDENQSLLVFPDCLNTCRDKIGDEKIFTLEGTNLTTGNIMGFVGVNDSELKIRSRFTEKDGEDYFLYYMLQKVFAINVFDLKHSLSMDDVFDFLFFMFPYYLKKALRQGLYKEYQRNEYNDANVRGAIDINRHIQKNIPFAGSVAYKTKEYSYDNRITQLIRHTIEYIKKNRLGQNILTRDSEIKDFISQIIYATPKYDRNKRHSVINSNLRPFSHPFFSEYANLQKICLQILRHEKLKYGKEKDKVYGLLFDGAWLWEEYINTILQKHGFQHPENKSGKNPIYIFEHNRGIRYPDFMKGKIVLDAKYKRLRSNSYSDVNRGDMHQIITYMYILKTELGGLIYPSDDIRQTDVVSSEEELNGYGGFIRLLTIPIPRKQNSYHDFFLNMTFIEDKLSAHIEIKSF